MFMLRRFGFLLVPLLASVGWADDAFDIAVIDSGDVGWYSSLALLSDGTVAIAYQDMSSQSLKVATVAGEDYTIERVTGGGGHCVLGVSSYDELTVLHCGVGGGPLLATGKSPWSGWDTVEVAAAVFSQFGPPGIAFALSARDEPHVVYVSSRNQVVRYAYYDRQRNEWVSTVISSGSCVLPAVAVKDDGQPVAGFVDHGAGPQVKVLVRGEMGWSALPPFVGETVSLGIDQTGEIAVVYAWQSQVLYRSFMSSIGWREPAVIYDGGHGAVNRPPVLKFDSVGHGHVVYSVNDKVMYSSSRGSWTSVTVEEGAGSTPNFLSLALDGEDRPLIAYQGMCQATGMSAMKLAAFDLPRPECWDLNCDGVINLLDYAELIQFWGPVPPQFEYDDNADGFIDNFELASLCEDWLWHRNYLDNLE